MDQIPISSSWMLGATGFGAAELIGLLIAFGVIVLIWRSRFKIVESSCGACEYPVRGLKSDRCPECGGVFSEVGIIPAGTKRGMSTLGRCVLWTIAFAFVGSLITDGVDKYAPATSTRELDLNLSNPDSNSYNSIDINFDEYIDLSGKIDQQSTIQLIAINGSVSAIAFIDLNEASIRFEENFASPTKIALDIESLLDWMKPSLPNTPRAALRSEATSILNTLNILKNVASNGRAFAGNGFSGSSLMEVKDSDSPYKDFATMLLVLIWLIGIIILIKQRPKSVYLNDKSSGVRMLY